MGFIYKISSTKYDKMTAGEGYWYRDVDWFKQQGDNTVEGNGIAFDGKSFDQVIDSVKIIENYFVLRLKNSCYIYGILWDYGLNINNVTENDLSINFLKFGDEIYNIIEKGLFDNPTQIKKVGEIKSNNDGNVVVNASIFNDNIDISGARPQKDNNGNFKTIKINAKEGHDYIVGSAYNDEIDAGKGDDEIYTGKGDDIIYGGEGDDYIKGGKGNNTIHYKLGNYDDGMDDYSDGYDIIQVTKNENLKINLQIDVANHTQFTLTEYVPPEPDPGQEQEEEQEHGQYVIKVGDNELMQLKIELQDKDVIISRIETVVGEGDNEETTVTPIMCLKDFGTSLSSNASGPASTNPSGSYGGAVLPASSSLTTRDKEVVPPVSAILMLNGDDDENNIINLAEFVYDVKASQKYTGTWLNEKIDASEAGSGVTILGKGGDDIMIGSQHDDIFNGGAGDNTIIYDRQDFGNDTIYQNLNGTSNLTVDISALPVGEYGEHGEAAFTYEVVGKDLKVTYWYYRLDDDGNRVQDEDGNEIIDTSTITFAELNTKKVAADNGGVFIKIGENDDDIIDIKNNVLPNTNPYFIFKNYNGTLLGDNINASLLTRHDKQGNDITEEHEKYPKTRGLTINGNYGNDIIVGTLYKDTIRGGAGNDTIRAWRGNDIIYGGKGADTFIFEKTDGVDTVKDATSADTIVIEDLSAHPITADDLTYARNKNNLEIYYTDEYDQNNKIIVQNYFKSRNKITTITLNGDDINIAEALQENGYAKVGSGKIYGTNNNDILIGSNKRDIIDTKAANDYVKAYAGNDIIYVNGSGHKDIVIGKNDGDDTINLALKNVMLTAQNQSIVNLVLEDLADATDIGHYNAGNGNLTIEIHYGNGNDAIIQKVTIKNMATYDGNANFELHINGTEWQNAINHFEPNPAPPINPAPAYDGNYDDINSSVSSWLSDSTTADAGLIPDEPYNDDLSSLILAQVNA